MIVNAQVLCEACHRCTRFEIAQDEPFLRIFDDTEEPFIFYCKHLDICMNAIDIWGKNEKTQEN